MRGEDAQLVGMMERVVGVGVLLVAGTLHNRTANKQQPASQQWTLTATIQPASQQWTLTATIPNTQTL